MPTVEQLLQGEIKLPSPPAIGMRILEAVKDENKSFAELAKIISSDPALTAKILKVANSSFYAVPQKVNSIPKALNILGTKTLKNIALSFVIVQDLRGDSAGQFNFDIFWKRSVTTAVGGELIAAAVKQKYDDAFVSGLLQDIGIVVLYQNKPEAYDQAFEEKRITRISIKTAERKIFGFDHQEVGAEILKRWELPESIYLPVRYHHAFLESPAEYRAQAELLSLANKISSVYHSGHQLEKINEVKTIFKEGYQIDENGANDLIDDVANRSIEILSFFEIEPGSLKPYSQILQEANEELKNLNISYEQLIIENKEAKEEAEQLAGELKVVNEKLRAMVFRDGLTGLFNHRYFQEMMGKELKRAERYQCDLALILCDLDDFKQINDSHGHPVGDIILKKVAEALTQSIREADTVQGQW